MIHLWGWVGPSEPKVLKSWGTYTSLPWEQARYVVTESFSLGVVWTSQVKFSPIQQSPQEIMAWAGHWYPSQIPLPETSEGDYAQVQWQTESETLTLSMDPCGGWPLFYAQVKKTFYFATELKLLLQAPGLSYDLDHEAIYHYLVFSFLPGSQTPLQGIRRLTIGQQLQWHQGDLQFNQQPVPIPPVPTEMNALETVRLRFSQHMDQAITERISVPQSPGLYLSGGLDSSAVGAWLRQSGIHPTALSLNFGKYSSELDEARQVAQHLDIPLHPITVPSLNLADLCQLVWKLDLPYGDPVTWPQYGLAQAARKIGLTDVFNGEGGDQLFGGWTNKPMIATQVYTPHQNPIEQYLKAYHRFYGEEQLFLSSDFAAQVKETNLTNFLEPYLSLASNQPFLHQLRLADLYLKGCYNIMPRALRIASSQGLAVHMPLFDRRLTQWVLSLPPEFKLQGAEEKLMLKWLLRSALPESILYRRKAGMNAPVTVWMGSWHGKYLSHQLFQKRMIRQRGLFRPEAIKALLKGENHPAETRRRRLGEKWWTLVMLELWLQVFVDGKGQKPV